MNKILIALVLAVVMSGNAYSESKTDKGLHYTCDYMSVIVFKTEISSAYWVDITGTIIKEVFKTQVTPLSIYLSQEEKLIDGGFINKMYFSIDRKTLKIVHTSLFKIYSKDYLVRLQDRSMSEVSRIVNSCKLGEPEDVEKILQKNAEKVRIAYENSIKY